MLLIDSHIHVSSRTTDDLISMKNSGVVAVVEPAFWLGQPRTNVGSFKDYFSALVGWERFRTEQFGIKYYCAIGLNAKESNNEAIAEAVIELLPIYIYKENVVAIGEIGFDDQTKAEERCFRKQLELALSADMPVIVHTPHRDKKQGVLKSMDICNEHGLDPSKVIIDHNNEETVKAVIDQGFWAGFTIYPKTKMGNERMVEVVKQYGYKQIIVNSSVDWGISDPLAVPKTARLMVERGISKETVNRTCYVNALEVYSMSGNMSEDDWITPNEKDQQMFFEGNSVLRGQSGIVECSGESEIIV